MKIYLSGPMTGYKNLNADAFYNAETSVKAKGHTPVNPHRIGEQLKRRGELPDDLREQYNAYLRADIAELMTCDTIHMLTGWRDSFGANAEFATARLCGIPVSYEK